MPSKLITKTFSGTVLRKASADDFEIVFKASDATPDSVGDRVFVEGMDLARFNANPVLLFNHDHTRIVGKGQVWVEGQGLDAALYMAPTFTDATEDSRNVKALIADGVLQAVSVGIAFSRDDATPNEFGGLDLKQTSLHEISFCAIGANPAALRVKTMDNENPKNLEGEDAEALLALVAEMQAAMSALTEKVAAVEAQVAAHASALEALQPSEDATAEEPEPSPAAESNESSFAKAFGQWLCSK